MKFTQFELKKYMKAGGLSANKIIKEVYCSSVIVQGCICN